MIDEIALPAFGLVGHALLVDLLIFRGQRRLLCRPEGLVGVELHALAAETGVVRVPLAFPVGIFRLVGGLRTADRHDQRCHQRRYRSSHCTDRISEHGFPPGRRSPKIWQGKQSPLSRYALNSGSI
jgi:hypothetical protein